MVSGPCLISSFRASMFSVMAAQWTAVRPGGKEEGEEERYPDVYLGVCLQLVKHKASEKGFSQ